MSPETGERLREREPAAAKPYSRPGQPRHGELDTITEPSERSSVIDFFNIILFNRRLILALVLPALVIAVVIAALRPRTYTSISSFISQGQGDQSQLSGLAAQLGIAVGGGGHSDNSAFSADLVKTRTILEAAVLSQYPIGSDSTNRQNLVEIYGIKGTSPQDRIDRAVKKLSQSVSVALNQRTGVVTVSVVAPDADLAHAVNQRLLDLINDFNLHTRQSQARTERVFTEKRLQEVGSDLRAAEDRLETFLEQNRNYMSSPTLTFDRERLARAVADQQSLHATLMESFERAKIDEVRDTPVITVVDRPTTPARPDSRVVLVIKVLFWVLLVLALVIGFAFVRARFTTRRHSSSPEVREFDRLVAEFNHELMFPFRKIKRVFARG